VPATSASTTPTLVFGWGNPSRGDDALGPLFVERIEALGLAGIDCLSEYQLQIEHIFELVERERILFVDASMAVTAPFAVSPLQPAPDMAQDFSHAIDPAVLLRVYEDFFGARPPPAFLLEIRGTDFSLGAPCSAAARQHLQAALRWARKWLE